MWNSAQLGGIRCSNNLLLIIDTLRATLELICFGVLLQEEHSQRPHVILPAVQIKSDVLDFIVHCYDLFAKCLEVTCELKKKTF